MANPFADFGIDDGTYDALRRAGMTDEQIQQGLARGGATTDANSIVLNGPDGQQQVQLRNAAGGFTAVPYGIDPLTFQSLDPQQRIEAMLLGNAKETRDTNRQAVMFGAGDVAAGQAAATAAADQQDAARIAALQQMGAGANTADAAALQQLRQATTGANTADKSILDTLAAMWGGANAADQQALAGLKTRAGAADQRQQQTTQQYGRQIGDLNDRDTALVDALAGRATSYGMIQPGTFGPVSSTAGGATADPEAVAAQKLFLNQYMAGSNPAMSATEKLMLEQARRKSEQEQKASRDATLRNLSARGVLGSGEEIAAMLGASAQTSQNRQLADLAALASAQQRSERQQAQGSALASDVRGGSFNERLQAGTAGDSMSRFNQSNSIQQAQYNAELARQQQEAEWARLAQATGAQTANDNAIAGRTGDVYNALTGANDAQYGRAQDVYGQERATTGDAFTRATGLGDTAVAANQTAYDRNATAAQGTAQLGANAYQRGQDVIGEQRGATSAQYGREQDRQGNTTDYVGLYTDQGTSGNKGVSDAYHDQLAGDAERRAEEALKDEDKGLFGLGIGPF